MYDKITEKRLHLIFEITVLLKGIHAFLETVGGFLFLLTPTAAIVSFVNFLTSDELGEDSRDFLAHYLTNAANQLSVSEQHFIALYLLSHGAVKLLAVGGLLKEKVWAYPSSIIIFIAFIAYQLYRYAYTHSPWLLVLSAFDAVLILLTFHEYRYIKSRLSRH